MQLSLIQSQQNKLYNFPGKEHFSAADALRLRGAMTDRVLSLTEEAAKSGADVIVTTEAVNFSGPFSRADFSYPALYSSESRPEEDAFSALAKAYGCYILAGLIRREEDGRLYNCAVFFAPDGTVRCVYRKIHLAGDENTVFTPGDTLCTSDTEFGRFGFAVCWDMQFPETARSLARMGADMILCPTWGWEWIYGPARAYENGIYAAAAMAVPFWMPICGLRRPSQVIAPDGTILAEGSCDREGIVACTLPDIRCKTSRDFRLATPLSL